MRNHVESLGDLVLRRNLNIQEEVQHHKPGSNVGLVVFMASYFPRSVLRNGELLARALRERVMGAKNVDAGSEICLSVTLVHQILLPGPRT